MNKLNKMYYSSVIDELNKRAIELTNEKVSNNKSVTIIKGMGETYREPAFSGCGLVWFSMDTKDWTIARKAGFNKRYRDWGICSKYWNGQYGDACSGYIEALKEMRIKYPNSFLDKVSIGSWID